MNNVKKYLLPSAIGITFCISMIALFWHPGKQRVAYVRMESVYNEFKLKTQLESKLKDTEKARQFILDSLKLQLHQMSLTLNSIDKADTSMIRLYNLRMQLLNQQEQQFVQDNQALANEFTDQIWGQINQYTKDYGTANGFDYILGASGDGTLMYASESEDITEELTEYINDRYTGGVK